MGHFLLHDEGDRAEKTDDMQADPLSAPEPPPLSPNWRTGFQEVAILWLTSRLVIAIAMLGIAPLLPAPPGGVEATVSWDVFVAWDSNLYQQIITSGYEYVDDGQGYNIAFFPLFPLLIRGLMALGIPFAIAGTLISNLAFFAMLLIVYDWVAPQHGSRIARWTLLALVWNPLSLFGTVVYTEGLFLFLSTAALCSFERQRYGWAALCSALASASRPPGIALLPTFFLVAWREQRPWSAYAAGLASTLGLLAFSLYCALTFGDPLAFVNVQDAWQPQAYWGQTWLKMLMEAIAGPGSWEKGLFYRPGHLSAVISGLLILVGLWRWRSALPRRLVAVLTGVLVLALWLIGGDPLLKLAMVVGSILVFWRARRELTTTPWFYGLFSLAIIFAPGRTISVVRHLYGVISISLALGMVLARAPRYRTGLVAFLGLLLVLFSIRFAQHQWVA